MAIKACLAREGVLFTTAADLLDELVAAQVSNTLGKVLQILRGQEFLVVDELGYTPMAPNRTALFFHLVSQKYGHSSLAVTTNLPFDQWGRLFGGDEVLAAAILDRLLDHSEVFAINGPSSRLRGKLGKEGSPSHPCPAQEVGQFYGGKVGQGKGGIYKQRDSRKIEDEERARICPD